MKQFSSQLGGKLGVGLCAAGFLAIFMGWNGAASVDRVPSQFPYLISGGLLGLCLIVCGIGLLVIQNQRADRAELQATLRELRQALAEAGLASNAPDTADRTEFALPTKRPTPPEYSLTPAVAETTQIEVVDAPLADDPDPETDDSPSRPRRGSRKPLRAKPVGE